MKLRILGAILFTALFLPSSLHAQDATVIGTVKDSTDAVLPGVTVTALNLENGNTFVDVSDAAGNYRLALRPGLYKITAELQGFTPAVRDKMELLPDSHRANPLFFGCNQKYESVYAAF